jgi:hypothetical protein
MASAPASHEVKNFLTFMGSYHKEKGIVIWNMEAKASAAVATCHDVFMILSTTTYYFIWWPPGDISGQ